MRTARADSLTWDVTADVGRFGEAVDFFSKRVVMTRDEALALDLDARKRAFWIGGGLQLSQVQSVFDEIGKALESGEPFDAFRKRLLTEVAIKPGHLDTVFRNATQRSYNAGRWEQMQAAKALRPYVMFDAVLDSRSSDICGTKIDGKICSIDDPFLKTNSPQRHHRCRTGLRSLRAKDAERRGLTPREELDGFPPAAPGFGVIPTDAPVWKPDPKKHDAKLVDELEKKEKKKPPKPKKPKGPPPEHDPAHWEAEYRKPSELAKNGYGDAAPALAWGRAMLERGLDRPVGDVVAELEKLVKTWPHQPSRNVLLGDIDTLRRYPQGKPLRSTVGAQVFRSHAAITEHMRSIRRGEFVPLPGSAAGQGVKHFYEAFLDASVRRPASARIVMWEELDESEWRPFFDGPRAHFQPRTKKVVLTDPQDARTAVHEFGHAIEDGDARALERSKAFLAARTVDEPLRVRAGYQSWEKFREDRFWNPYVGHGLGREQVDLQSATEVTSNAYEWLASARSWRKFADADPDHFAFALGQLAGR